MSMEELMELVKPIRLLALDVDGVLTDGRLYYAENGEILKTFDCQDGLGIQLLQASGVACAVITARQSSMVEIRARELGIKHIIQNCKNKRLQLEQLASLLNFTQKQVAYVGDDLPDLAAMHWCGLSIAVANARSCIQKMAAWNLKSSGGRGAIREISDTLINMQGKDIINIFETLQNA